MLLTDKLSPPYEKRRESLAYQPHIDGLRAIAVAVVVVFHAFPTFVSGGFVGVDVFFVISGFLISRIIITELALGTFNLSRFYAARARRIFPALSLVLAAVLLTAALILPRNGIVDIARHTAAGALFVANFYSMSKAGYFGAASIEEPLLHLWSLGIEEQFYLVWPIGLAFLWATRRNLGLSIGLVAAASFALSIAFGSYREAVFYLPLTRAWELMLGAAIAWLGTEGTASLRARTLDFIVFAGIGMITAAVFFFNDTLRYPGFYALAPTVGTALVLWAGGSSNGPAAGVLRSAPAVWLGKISYPLYLWHWPLLSLFALKYPLREGSADRVLLCIVAVLLGWLTYRFLELPLRRRHKDNNPRIILAFGAPLAGLAVLAGSIAATTSWTDPPKELASIANFSFDVDTEYRLGRCHLQPNQSPEAFKAECFAAMERPGRNVLLWGDSTATALSIGLRSLAQQRSYAVTELTSSACPPLLGFTSEARPNCAAVNAFVMDQIASRKPDVVVMSMLDYGSSSRLQGTIEAIKQAGVRTVVLVGSPPLWPTSLPHYILSSYEKARRLQTSLPITQRSRQRMTEWNGQLRGIAEAAGAIYVSAADLLCTSAACLAISDGEPVAYDEIHLTRAGSALVARAIYDALEGQ